MVAETAPDRRMVTPVVLVSCFLTCAAGILLFPQSGTDPLGERIGSQLVAVCILFALSSFGFYSSSYAFRLTVFLIKLFFTFFVASAAGSLLHALVCLVSSYMLEAYYFNGIRTAAALSLAFLGVLFFSVAGSTSWNIRQPDITAGETAILVLFAASAAVTGSIASSAIRTNLKNEGEIRRLEEAVTNLTKTNTAYQTYATYIEETSKEEERHRISREIHDIVGYSMTNLLMIVQAALYSENQDQVTELLQKAQTHINESLLEVRMALRKLRSTQKKHCTEAP